LHDRKAGSVTGRVAKVDSRCKLEERSVPSWERVSQRKPIWTSKSLTLKVQVKPKILRQVHSNVRLRRDGEIGVLDFLFVDVDRHVGPLEVFKSASVIEVKVAHDNGFDVFDVMACLLDLGVELVFFGVVDAGEDVVQWRAPDFGVVFTSARFEQDQAFGRVLDQDGDDDHFPAGYAWVGVAQGGGAAATDHPSFLDSRKMMCQSANGDCVSEVSGCLTSPSRLPQWRSCQSCTC
jgi:hypothetical protein